MICSKFEIHSKFKCIACNQPFDRIGFKKPFYFVNPFQLCFQIMAILKAKGNSLSFFLHPNVTFTVRSLDLYTHIYMDTLFGVSQFDVCTIEFLFTHQWWELGLYWASWGLPYTGFRAIRSLRTKYAMIDKEGRLLHILGLIGLLGSNQLSR